MKNFTVEETNLMCCFNTSSRKRLIDDMKSVTLNDMDGEIAELMYSLCRSFPRSQFGGQLFTSHKKAVICHDGRGGDTRRLYGCPMGRVRRKSLRCR